MHKRLNEGSWKPKKSDNTITMAQRVGTGIDNQNAQNVALNICPSP
jgi:hypothetical protein